jgi:hypothetical protein
MDTLSYETTIGWVLSNVNLAVHVIQLYSMARTINLVKMDDTGVKI